MAPRNYARLHFDYYNDPVMEAAAIDEPAALWIWPILVCMAKEASHAKHNPHGVFERSITALARITHLEPDRVRKALGVLQEGEFIRVENGRKKVVKITLTNFERWQVPNRGSAETSQTHRDNSRGFMPERDISVTRYTEDIDIDKDINPYSSTSSKRKQTSFSKPANEVFEHWRNVMGKRSNTIFSADRKTKIVARLREGYTVEQLKQSIDGYASSSFHRGENPQGKAYDDLTLICRDGSHVEAGIEYAQGAPVAAATVSSTLPERFRKLIGGASDVA